MHVSKWVTLKNDIDGLVVPAAMPITIPSGTQVEVLMHKGRGITISAGGQLIRVESHYASDLGLELPDNHFTKQEIVDKPLTEEVIWEALKTCHDPEIPVNIVDLGLVYSVKLLDGIVYVEMTLTAPTCSMGPVLVQDVKATIEDLPHAKTCNVELVFSPPWDKTRMSAGAQLELGLL